MRFPGISSDLAAARDLVRRCAEEQHEYAIDLKLDGFEALARVSIWNRRYHAQLVASLLNAQITTHPDCIYEPSFWQRVLPSLERVGRPYLLIGDSHSRLCRLVGANQCAPIVPIHILCTAGSALGLSNPQARSGYGSHLKRLAEVLTHVDATALPIVFQFGQVDLEFVSTFRRIATGRNAFDAAWFETFSREVAGSYTTFLTEHFGGFRTHAASVFPPALSDAAWKEGYVNAHVAELEGEEAAAVMRAVQDLDIPDLLHRTALHRRFNDLLRIRCQETGLQFLDLFQDLVGADETVRPDLVVNSGGRDHHLDFDPTRSLIRPILQAEL